MQYRSNARVITTASTDTLSTTSSTRTDTLVSTTQLSTTASTGTLSSTTASTDTFCTAAQDHDGVSGLPPHLAPKELADTNLVRIGQRARYAMCGPAREAQDGHEARHVHAPQYKSAAKSSAPYIHAPLPSMLPAPLFMAAARALSVLLMELPADMRSAPIFAYALPM
eukprot:2111855-Rhodomonas_salina.6